MNSTVRVRTASGSPLIIMLACLELHSWSWRGFLLSVSVEISSRYGSWQTLCFLLACRGLFVDYCFKDRSVGFFFGAERPAKTDLPNYFVPDDEAKPVTFWTVLKWAVAICDTIYGSFGDGQNYITIFRWINLREDHTYDPIHEIECRAKGNWADR